MSDPKAIYPPTQDADTQTSVGKKIEVLEPGEVVTSLEPGEEVSSLSPGEVPTELSSGEDEVLLSEEDLTAPATAAASSSLDPATLIALQGIINRQSAKLDVLKDDVKKLSESAKSIVENDQELSKIEEQAQEIIKLQKERKQSLTNSPESMQLKIKMKEIKESIKDLEESLNNHLLNFYQMTGVKVFDTDDGAQREFEVRAKLRAKKKAL